MADDTASSNTTDLAAELTIAWLSNANTRASADDAVAFLGTAYEALTSLESSSSKIKEATAEPAETREPAVTVRKSLASRDYIISLIDGKPYRMLRRHLAKNGLTPDGYRERYGLKPDYPMVAPAYSEQRSDMAKRLGLGNKAGQKLPRKSSKASTN